MINDDFRMRVAVCLMVVVAACGTKPNPHSCQDGLCTDQSYPFCDVDGTLGGDPKECISVSCMPEQFEACRGDEEIRCNATGNNYDLVQCELGCSAATDGCRLCNPNETRCTNGKVATCDPNGAVASMESCLLGCYEDQPRCRRIAPSNDLGQYLDLPATLPDIDLNGATFNTATGVVTRNADNFPVMIPNFTAANGDGPTIRVFLANNVRLRDVQAFSSNTKALTGPAFALVARGEITIEGRFIAHGDAGGITNAVCSGGIGNYVETGSSSRAVASGGGGNATAGAKGGNIGSIVGGAGGEAFGTDALVPLKGGCSAGGVDNSGTVVRYAMWGGGAIQLTSEKAINVLGIIDVRGQPGESEQAGTQGAAVYGGGAGGSILLEAPQVSLGPAAILMAKGGGGGSLGPSTIPDDTANPDPGNVCAGTCADGGNGAAPGVEAQPGQPSPTDIGAYLSSGGGGGGLGRVRINTRDTTYLKPNTAIEAAIVTTGLIKTR